MKTGGLTGTGKTGRMKPAADAARWGIKPPKGRRDKGEDTNNRF